MAPSGKLEMGGSDGLWGALFAPIRTCSRLKLTEVRVSRTGKTKGSLVTEFTVNYGKLRQITVVFGETRASGIRRA
jgi:hypothetical protein